MTVVLGAACKLALVVHSISTGRVSAPCHIQDFQQIVLHTWPLFFAFVCSCAFLFSRHLGMETGCAQYVAVVAHDCPGTVTGTLKASGTSIYQAVIVAERF